MEKEKVQDPGQFGDEIEVKENYVNFRIRTCIKIIMLIFFFCFVLKLGHYSLITEEGFQKLADSFISNLHTIVIAFLMLIGFQKDILRSFLK